MSELYQIQVHKGEEVKDVIMKFILEKQWDGAVILGAIGSVYDVRYSTPCGTKEGYTIEMTNVSAPAELLSFTGEVMRSEKVDQKLKIAYKIEGEYFIHIHASAAVVGGSVYGGGFQKGNALRAVNVFIQEASFCI